MIAGPLRSELKETSSLSKERVFTKVRSDSCPQGFKIMTKTINRGHLSDL